MKKRYKLVKNSFNMWNIVETETDSIVKANMTKVGADKKIKFMNRASVTKNNEY